MVPGKTVEKPFLSEGSGEIRKVGRGTYNKLINSDLHLFQDLWLLIISIRKTATDQFTQFFLQLGE